MKVDPATLTYLGSAVELLKDCDAFILPFEELPETSRMALAQYMSIDGERGDAAPNIIEALAARPAHSETGEYLDGRVPEDVWEQLHREALPFYARQYRGMLFGYAPAVPMAPIIEAVMRSPELTNDFKYWEEYHRWYMTRRRPKHTASGKEPWPSILYWGFDEVFEDGWTRFHQYAEQGRTTMPLVWFVPDSTFEGDE